MVSPKLLFKRKKQLLPKTWSNILWYFVCLIGNHCNSCFLFFIKTLNCNSVQVLPVFWLPYCQYSHTFLLTSAQPVKCSPYLSITETLPVCQLIIQALPVWFQGCFSLHSTAASLFTVSPDLTNKITFSDKLWWRIRLRWPWISLH